MSSIMFFIPFTKELSFTAPILRFIFEQSSGRYGWLSLTVSGTNTKTCRREVSWRYTTKATKYYMKFIERGEANGRQCFHSRRFVYAGTENKRLFFCLGRGDSALLQIKIERLCPFIQKHCCRRGKSVSLTWRWKKASFIRGNLMFPMECTLSPKALLSEWDLTPHRVVYLVVN